MMIDDSNKKTDGSSLISRSKKLSLVKLEGGVDFSMTVEIEDKKEYSTRFIR